jgi:hypothetical protein
MKHVLLFALLAFLCGQSAAAPKPPNVVFFLDDDLIRNWLRNRNTVEFLGIWERLNNPGFNPIEFDGIGMQAGLNSFILTARQWIERTGAVGIVSKAGRYGGTYAHTDIPRRLIAVCTNLGVHRVQHRENQTRQPRLALARAGGRGERAFSGQLNHDTHL